MADGFNRFWAPRWALVWDFALIGCYAYLLSWFAVAAFERHAGLRRIGDPVPRLLARLGWALPLAVFSDVGENIATWATITLVSNELIALAFLSAIAMSVRALLKFVGLVGTIALCTLPSSILTKKRVTKIATDTRETT